MSKTIKVIIGLAAAAAIFYFVKKSRSKGLTVQSEGVKVVAELKPTQKSIYDGLTANQSGTIKAVVLTDGRKAVLYEEPRPTLSPARMFFFEDNTIIVERKPEKDLAGKFNPTTWLFEIGSDKLQGMDMLSGVAQVLDFYKII
jgi:hypothetical protein